MEIIEYNSNLCWFQDSKITELKLSIYIFH